MIVLSAHIVYVAWIITIYHTFCYVFYGLDHKYVSSLSMYCAVVL
jgi:hypothetical protein